MRVTESVRKESQVFWAWNKCMKVIQLTVLSMHKSGSADGARKPLLNNKAVKGFW